MTEQADAATLTIALDRADPEPGYVQIYAQIRELILAGRVAPGSRLPSTRALAAETGVSRTTTLAAYDQLTAEGYLENRVGAGAFVSRDLPDTVLAAPPAGRVPSPAGTSPAPAKVDPPWTRPRTFDPGIADRDAFPLDEWTRSLLRSHRALDRATLFGRGTGGFEPLREAIAGHLRAMRGFDCAAGQVIVTSGAQEAVALLARVLLRPGDTVWMEDPGYGAVRRAFSVLGARVACIPVDGEGFDLEQALASAPGARLAFVTPSRHYPLGMTMPLARRLALIDWARSEGAWVIEDDFDSEYRYRGRPLASLMSLAGDRGVVYLGSFSKVMFQNLRLSWLVAPPALARDLVRAQADIGAQVSIVAQPALADFIATGRFAAHIRRMRRLYAARQSHLVAEVARLADDLLDVAPQDGGMHLIARPKPALARRMSDREASERARDAGLTIVPLSGFYAGEAAEQGFLLGYAGVPEAEITAGIERLAGCLR
jgi:GntR family transcriptional regulator / MocR family aminotransferase